MERSILDRLGDDAELKLNNYGYASHEAGWVERKRHPDYDVWMITEGEVSLGFAGRTAAAREGDLVFFHPEIAYTARCDQSSCSHLFIHFDFSLGERDNILHEFVSMGVISNRLVQEEAGMLRQAFQAYRENKPMASLLLRGYFLALLARLLAIPIPDHDEASRKSQGSSRALARLQPILHYIDEHVGEPITAERLAERIGMSPKYFYTFFKANIGFTPQHYITRIRLNRARELLLEGERSVKEIAYQLGYPDPYTFSKQFKRYHHMSPSRFSEHT
ncbi:AraC family transcriptional regulator [Paenibacillus sp. J5C_2022]|uniref:helix-turn-helix transcriptional regulator n=1 Tax=Paenibacillus sp. J5C2022 TaxID=2977129 RepID=UPI0021D2F826|nr:AraC family transcriptional regulator [Paenibacillus sp. J5C2022]MCU6711300.1 AraC family transcriptional regulator [Paenibacillus sp. J5C2022]